MNFVSLTRVHWQSDGFKMKMQYPYHKTWDCWSFNIHKKNSLVPRNPSFCQLESSNHNWYVETLISNLDWATNTQNIFFPAVKKTNTPNRAEITFVHDGSDVWLWDIYHVSVNVLSTAPCLRHASLHKWFQPQPTTPSLTNTDWKATEQMTMQWGAMLQWSHASLVTCSGVSKYLCIFFYCTLACMFVYTGG